VAPGALVEQQSPDARAVAAAIMKVAVEGGTGCAGQVRVDRDAGID
jgi:hypothetical protein